MASLSELEAQLRRAVKRAFKGSFRAPLRTNADGDLEIKPALRTRRPPAKIDGAETMEQIKINGLIDWAKQIQGSLEDAKLMEE